VISAKKLKVMPWNIGAKVLTRAKPNNPTNIILWFKTVGARVSAVSGKEVIS